jgi:hypothetical protein
MGDHDDIQEIVSSLYFAVLNNDPELIDKLPEVGRELDCRTKRRKLTPSYTLGCSYGKSGASETVGK